MLEECRKDNREFMTKIEDLQATLFGKDREIDKLKHSIKFGKVSGALS